MGTFFFSGNTDPVRIGLMAIAVGAGWAILNVAITYWSDIVPETTGRLYPILYAPITEEIVFRGYWNVFCATIGIPGNGLMALSLSGFLFGLAHVLPTGASLSRQDAQLFLVRFLFGILAYYLYVQTGSLLVPILMHASGNAVLHYAEKTVFKRKIAEHDKKVKDLEQVIQNLQAKIQKSKRLL